MIPKLISLTLFIAIIITGCNRDLDNQANIHNSIIDSATTFLYTKPQRAKDILKSLCDTSISTEQRIEKDVIENIINYNLTGKILDHNTLVNSIKWYLNNNDLYNITRAQVYLSIHLFNTNRNDPNSYLILNEALDRYLNNNFNDPALLAQIYLIQGQINYRKNQKEIAKDQFLKSIAISKENKVLILELSGYIELFNLYLSIRDFESAIKTIAPFANNMDMPPYLVYRFNSCMYSYYFIKKDYEIALGYLQKNLNIDYESISNQPRLYYQISYLHKLFNNPDSTLFYAKKAVEAAEKSNSITDNLHFYFRNLSNLYYQMGEYKLSAEYSAKALRYQSKSSQFISKEKAEEIEKRFDLKKHEIELQNLKAQKRLLLYLIFTITILFPTGIIIQRGKNKRRLDSIQKEISSLKNEIITSEILKNNGYILPKILNEIYLEASRIRKLSTESYESFSRIIENSNNSFRSGISQIANNRELISQLEIKEEDLNRLTDFEKMVFILNNQNYSVDEIASFLNTTTSSVKTLKRKIEIKLEKQIKTTHNQYHS